MITNNLSTLRIHSLSEEQYNKEKQSSNLENNALYLIPAPEIEIAQETGSSEEITISQKVITKELNNKNNILSNALKGSATGEAISIIDISPVEHNLKIGIKSKNLANPQVFLNNGGVLQSDNIYYFENSGNISKVVIWENVNNDSVICISYQLKTKYFDDATYTGIRFLVEYSDGTKNNVGFEKSEDYIPITFISSVNKKAVRVIGDYGTRNNSTWIKDFQIEIGTTATAYTPYIADIEAVKVRAQGKNLFDVSKIPTSATIINNNDGTVLVKGNAQSTGRQFRELCPNLKVGDTFTISLRVTNAVQDTKETGYIYLGYFYTKSLASRKSYTVTEDMLNGTTYLYKSDYPNSGNVTEGVVSEIQVELGTVATDYEPYKEPVEYTQNENIKSIYPCTTLTTDTTGALIECEYNRDINKAFAEIVEAVISLGQNI